MYSELEEDILQEKVNTSSLAVVQYGANWCGNCKILKPKFKRLAQENAHIEFYYVDAERLPESRKLANVSNLPTIAGFKDGQLVHQSQGNKIDSIIEVIDALTSN